MTEKKPAALIWEAISKGDVEGTKRLLVQNPDLVDAYIPFGGGTFLHLAASKPNLDLVRMLVELGFDLNREGSLEGDGPIAVAAAYGNYDTVEYLLNSGARLDVSSSGRNPLFGAIIGGSLDIVKLLLDRGIDYEVRYNSDTMIDMDATAFALERGEAAIARAIAEKSAKGDQTKVSALLEKAMRIAEMNNR